MKREQLMGETCYKITFQLNEVYDMTITAYITVNTGFIVTLDFINRFNNFIVGTIFESMERFCFHIFYQYKQWYEHPEKNYIITMELSPCNEYIRGSLTLDNGLEFKRYDLYNNKIGRDIVVPLNYKQRHYLYSELHAFLLTMGFDETDFIEEME